jgi:hypothetical protein
VAVVVVRWGIVDFPVKAVWLWGLNGKEDNTTFVRIII